MRSGASFNGKFQLLLATLLFNSAKGSELELIKLDHGHISALGDLIEPGNACSSRASIQCFIGTKAQYLDDSLPKIPCKNNLRLKRSECPTRSSEVNQAVTIVWEYCNNDNIAALPFDRTAGKYKNRQVRDFPTRRLSPGQCNRAVHEKNINLCREPSVAMNLKYQGRLPRRSGSYCFAYRFLRVRRTWVREEACTVSAEVSCNIKNTDKQCLGNIANAGTCRDIDVVWTFKHCFWNVDGTLVYEGKTRGMVNETRISIRNKSNQPHSEKCRIQTLPGTISTCDDRIGGKFRVKGHLASDEGKSCDAYDFHRVIVDVPCSYNFLITEITDPMENSKFRYVEIYTPNCAGKVILEDLKVVLFKRENTIPNQSDPISLQGRIVPDDGFFVFCATDAGKAHYGEGVCDEVTLPPSPAGSDGWDQIAIIRGPIGGPYEIMDIFGEIGEHGRSTDHDFQNGRVVRKFTADTPSNGAWIPENYLIERAPGFVSVPSDPRRWSPN